jgi:hypothetical protein
MHKFNIISLVILLIILIFIYIYVKKENFDNTVPTTSSVLTKLVPTTTSSSKLLSQEPISVQLKSEIGRVLGISPLRIYKLKYEGDIETNSLNVDFDILDSNVDQKVMHEISKADAGKLAMNLMLQDNFFVKIKNKTIILRRLHPKTPKNLNVFNNEGLKEVKKYANDRYVSVPNDDSLTKFYTLSHDTNYNLVPKI